MIKIVNQKYLDGESYLWKNLYVEKYLDGESMWKFICVKIFRCKNNISQLFI